MKRKKKVELLVIEPEVVESETTDCIKPLTEIKLQNVPNLRNAIMFSLMAIRDAKKRGERLNIEINLTNVYTFANPVEKEVKAIDKVTQNLIDLL